jgi:hypothetical protein
MKAFETTATVDKSGALHLESVPFAPGTQVEVTVSTKFDAVTAHSSDTTDSQAHGNVEQLLAALDKARNTESVGPLRREELYDRKVLR